MKQPVFIGKFAMLLTVLQVQVIWTNLKNKKLYYYTESKMEMFVVHVTYLEYTRKPVSGDVYTFKE